MFLHSGASLHGHEYSHRPPPNNPPVANRRNTLLRSAFSTPINRASTYPPPSRLSPNENQRPKSAEVSRAPSARTQRRSPEAVVRFQEPGPDPAASPVPKMEVMSEDDGSCFSDSDASRASSSLHRPRRCAARKSTSYVLALPPPKLRTKQRIIHIRPKLLLQVQQFSAGRPRPAIDVYPSSAITRSIFAPLLKRFPRIARIKSELSIQDVMLVKSEDYGAQSSDSDSDGDEDNIKSRDLVAILSPLRTEDKTEIVLADGTVWVATPRSNRNNGSYEFTSVDPSGNATTARWIRKQVVSKSLPATPTTTPPPSTRIQTPDYKFTFSIIDPECRRHPIMATLTSSSLEILEAYTTVSQTASRYPPTSSALSQSGSLHHDEGRAERTTRPVEDWQKNFISVSAVWVALRHGWAPNCRPADIVSPSASGMDTSVTGRGRSLSANHSMAPKQSNAEALCRLTRNKSRQSLEQSPNGSLPRRATSTGAAFIEKRRQMQRTSEGPPGNSCGDGMPKPGRRAFSSEWSVGTRRWSPETSLTEMMESDSSPVDTAVSIPSNGSGLAPPPLPTGRRAISAYYPMRPMTPERAEASTVKATYYGGPDVHEMSELGSDARRSKGKHHHRWKSMTGWFRKISGR
ncbi:hypothetical protein F4780DRAFT_772694 [Xylariomycetidae sp. FL0641]|nr:hypothetical protein F4780DRAFT_772694 [Xylariomycetidae sp. FL0641]